MMAFEPASGEVAAELNALIDEAREMRRAGRETNAYFQLLMVLERSREAALRKEEARALLGLADVVKWVDTGKNGFAESERLAKESLVIYEELEDKLGMARCWQMLASSVDYEKGLQICRDALAVFREIEDRSEIARSLDRLASLTVFRDREEAKLLRTEALEIYEDLGDVAGQAGVLFGLSIGEMSNRSVSREYAERALEKYRQANRPKQVAQMLMFLDDPEAAPAERIPRLEEGIRCSAETNTFIWQASMMRNLADCLAQNGLSETAADLRREADLIHPEMKMDPEEQKAFEEALESKDPSRMADVLKEITFGVEDEESENGYE